MRSLLTSLQGPMRTLALLHGIDGVGGGFFVAGVAVYLTQVTHLSAEQIGTGLTVGGLMGLTAPVMSGALADTLGARRHLAGRLVVLGCGFLVYPAVSAAWQFYLLAGFLGALQFGLGPSFVALIAEFAPEETRVTTRAAIRAVGNASMGLGTLAAALLAALGSHPMLQLFPLVNGASFVVAGLLVLRLPRTEVRPGPGGGLRLVALRDRRLQRVVAVNALLGLHDTVLSIGIPLWIIVGTHLPKATIPLLIGLNTVLVVLLQMRFARGAEELSGAARVARRAGLAGAAGCLPLAVSGAVPLWAAAALVVLALVLVTAAELWHSASAFSLGFAVAPEERRSEYLGAFQLYHSLQTVLGPLLLAALVGTGHGGGWLVVAALFGAAGLLVPPIVAGIRPQERQQDHGQEQERERAAAPADERAPASVAAAPSES
ncbi:MFS transporter [Streptacidiphilus neutrinimicus]|uniref:MFS transporter n=1 Tax=Streptacidiphilus neutrinimicus TaxID=105420 RepID=UPI0006933FEB|nr:MFS transporter [Streptacidiphilus neutrinimicus]